ncbi:MAG: shikimate dehydrogenase [Gallionella sp.]
MTDKYAVIGNPVAHSKSPQIHRMFAEQTGQDISYEAILAPLDGFAEKIEELRKAGYKGCNVTVPFKQSAYQLSNQNQFLTYHVVHAHAANTLDFRSDGVHLHNTDGIGLLRDIQDNCGMPLRGKRVLLMGAGGAASGVLSPLRDAGANITVANRTVDKAIILAERFVVSSCSYGELAGKQFDVIINATSTGLSDEMPPLPPGIFAPGAFAYEMMYGRETPFMKFALSQGVSKDRVVDGLGMLVEQAAESFFIWRAVRPDTAPVIAALRKQQ